MGSSVVMLFVVEALIEALQSSAWKTTRDRMKDLEGLLETSQLFRAASVVQVAFPAPKRLPANRWSS